MVLNEIQIIKQKNHQKRPNDQVVPLNSTYSLAGEGGSLIPYLFVPSSLEFFRLFKSCFAYLEPQGDSLLNYHLFHCFSPSHCANNHRIFFVQHLMNSTSNKTYFLDKSFHFYIQCQFNTNFTEWPLQAQYKANIKFKKSADLESDLFIDSVEKWDRIMTDTPSSSSSFAIVNTTLFEEKLEFETTPVSVSVDFKRDSNFNVAQNSNWAPICLKKK
ncbi:hypothetical protein HMI56_001456 [Coelomomyces lativittatus]|nr:hypothetical protein HMI56_001456 [Coelomomyces lativittatus]